MFAQTGMEVSYTPCLHDTCSHAKCKQHGNDQCKFCDICKSHAIFSIIKSHIRPHQQVHKNAQVIRITVENTQECLKFSKICQGRHVDYCVFSSVSYILLGFDSPCNWGTFCILLVACMVSYVRPEQILGNGSNGGMWHASH